MRLRFDHANGYLYTYAADGTELDTYLAANNVDSHSRGHWPDGWFDFDHWQSHTPDAEGPFGLHGILIFDVHGRTGMGLHSGQRTTPDGLGRKGVDHCTEGCIRTTDEAMAAILARHNGGDRLTGISVGQGDEALS